MTQHEEHDPPIRFLPPNMDWHSRYVLAWKLSNTLETSFHVAALEQGIQVSMDGEEGVGTTSLWSVCGDASSMRRCI